MKSPSISVAMALGILLNGCMGDFLPPPNMRVAQPEVLEAPADISTVNPQTFPRYKSKAGVTPPPWVIGSVTGFPMAGIETSDEWRVTHKVGDIFLIFSEAYQYRQCKKLFEYGPNAERGMVGLNGECKRAMYLYHVAITPSGEVINGWVLIPNPDALVSGPAYSISSNPQSKSAIEKLWGVQPLFARQE
jgi:hypothetical protein